MSEREEMELAAKAYGVQLHWKEGSCKGGPYESAFIERGGELVPWRPREDDGDALRLATRLDLHITPWSVIWNTAAPWKCSKTIWGPDRDAAVRCAIFLAAVALGKQ